MVKQCKAGKALHAEAGMNGSEVKRRKGRK